MAGETPDDIRREILRRRWGKGSWRRSRGKRRKRRLEGNDGPLEGKPGRICEETKC